MTPNMLLFQVNDIICCTQSLYCGRGIKDLWFCGAVIAGIHTVRRLNSLAIIWDVDGREASLSNAFAENELNLVEMEGYKYLLWS